MTMQNEHWSIAMKDLSSRACFVAVAMARLADGAIITVPLEDFGSEGLAAPAVCEAHTRGFRFVQVLGIVGGEVERAEFPGKFPEDILRGTHERFMELAIERGAITATAQA